MDNNKHLARFKFEFQYAYLFIRMHICMIRVFVKNAYSYDTRMIHVSYVKIYASSTVTAID